ncbi:MAG: anti-sigma factor [Chitinophagaceae bacterium]
MNIQEYISSGIIESYVLGLSSKEESAEFEKLCSEYPELVMARTSFEIAFEKQLLNDAPVAEADLKERVMNAIKQQSPVNQIKIITMQSSNTNRSSSGLRWLAAASIILLLGSAYFAYTFYSENQKLKDSNDELVAKAKASDSLSRANDSIANLMAEEQKLVSDPNIAVVNMTGTTKASSASIYWDSTSANVYLVVKNMPQLPSDKQYQLWALIDGKPKDLGLFDVGASKKFFLKMNNTQKADAFAITIEDRGNKGGPNLGQLQNMGKTKL